MVSQNSAGFGAAPPAKLVVVSLWWVEASSASIHGRFTCKTSVLVSGGTRIRTGDTMIFRHVPPSGAHRRKPLLPAVPARAPLGCALPSALYPLSPPPSCGMAVVARGPDQRKRSESHRIGCRRQYLSGEVSITWISLVEGLKSGDVVYDG